MVSVGQELRRGSARWFRLGVSHVAAVNTAEPGTAGLGGFAPFSKEKMTLDHQHYFIVHKKKLGRGSRYVCLTLATKVLCASLRCPHSHWLVRAHTSVNTHVHTDTPMHTHTQPSLQNPLTPNCDDFLPDPLYRGNWQPCPPFLDT